MSSDCFNVRVKKVAGTEVVVDVLTGTAGGLDDYASSRSFALVLLNDAALRAWEDAPSESEAKRLKAKGKASSLAKALEGEGNWYVDEKWMQKNVGRFVEDCTLVERHNNVGEEELQRREEEITEAVDDEREAQSRRWKKCHNFTLRLVVSDRKWAEHLEPGLEFGTTAYDVWYERKNESAP